MAERGVFSFQSTRPMRGATTNAQTNERNDDISIHAPHAGRDRVSPHLRELLGISIHAPHAGRDADDDGGKRRVLISIHAPRAGRDCHSRKTAAEMSKFQSTRPVRGATPMRGAHRRG